VFAITALQIQSPGLASVQPQSAADGLTAKSGFSKAVAIVRALGKLTTAETR
jgi:hypothetical protein